MKCERYTDHELPAGGTWAYRGCGCRHDGPDPGPKVKCEKCGEVVGRECPKCELVY